MHISYISTYSGNVLCIYKISWHITDPVYLIKVTAACILRTHKMLLKYNRI